MSSKPAPSPEVFRSQEAAFIAHYDWLMRWALQFTNNDRARAEDLVQQVFAQFAFAQTDLSAVQNVPAYLYTTLRNTHVSEVRLAGRSHGRPQSIVEYSIADAALGASDPYTLFQIQDQLRRVCQYACLRKQTSRAGCVLILRFFHGYHLSEVAEVLGGTCQAIRQSLKFARNEARVFLEDPSALKFIDRADNVCAPVSGTVCAAEQLLTELRCAIFASCHGECLGHEDLLRLYGEHLIEEADNFTLAHLVSCPTCLDSVNRTLGLPLLAERHPADALGPNNSWRGGPGGPRNGGGTNQAVQSRRRAKTEAGKVNSSFLLRCRRRATELFEHHPRELCVSVNGHVLGSQSVNSQISRLRVDVTINEDLSFVEVLSEERARLLVMPIQPPPIGEPTQERRVALSEDRCLTLTLRYGHPWPMVEVVYEDPNFTSDAQPATLNTESRVVARVTSEPEQSVLLKLAPARHSPREGLFDLFRSLSLLRRSLWTHPNFISALVSLVLISALLILRFNIASTVTAATLLERARTSESQSTPTHLAVHRTIELEQRRHGGGELIAKNRIEIWRDSERSLSVRRVYDGQSKLIAGEWIQDQAQAGGKPVRRIYHRDQPQRIEAGAPSPHQAIRSLELWQLDLMARDYAELIGQSDAARVSETANAYFISYDASETRNDGLLQASLTLRRSDLHAIAQTLVIKTATDTFDYGLKETSYEQPLLRSISPAIFEPDVELFSNPHGERTTNKRGSAPSPATNTPSEAASAELEIEIAYVLDEFRTRFGDQVTLSKTPAGLLEVKGVVDTDDTRKEILKALSRVIDHPAVRVHISTAAEVLKRQQSQSERELVQEFAASDHSIPLYSELSRHFSAQGNGQSQEQVDQLVRDFAARVVSRSRRALSHALELKQLSARFSATELDRLTPSARAKWFGLVRNHAGALQQELTVLDGELQRTLGIQGDLPAGEAFAFSDDGSLLLAIERLYKLVLANDEAVRSAFAASRTPATGESVRGSRFRAGLATSVKLADSIRQAADR